MKYLITISILFLGLIATAQKIPTQRDTLDIGKVYSNDTVSIKAKIYNFSGRTASIKRVVWKPNSEFSNIKYDKSTIPSGRAKFLTFKVRNIVKRNAIINRILIVHTEYQIYHILVLAKFDAGKNPEKKITLPSLNKITSKKSKKKKVVVRNKQDSVALKTVAKALPKVDKKPTKIVRSPNETTDSVIRYSTEFMGTPYVFGGYTPEGFDCSGFVQYVFKGVNYKLPRTSRAQANVGISIDKSQAKPGDLIFFEGSQQNGIVGHVGIIVFVDSQGIVFIHSSTKKGVTLSELEYNYYSSRLLAIKRVIN